MKAAQGSGPAHPIDDLLPYLLGELDPLARRAVDRHLDRCASCRAELARLDEGWVATVEALPPEPTGDAAWAAIAARVASPAAPVPRSAPSATAAAPPATRRRPARGAWSAGMIATLALAAAVGAWGIGQRQLALELRADLAAARAAADARVADLDAALADLAAQARGLADEQALVARWLAETGVTVASVTGDADGSVGAVLLRADGAALVVMGAVAEADRSYQAWGVAGGAVTSLGTFEGRVLHVPTDGYEAIALSLEPLGGSPSPTVVLGAAPLG